MRYACLRGKQHRSQRLADRCVRRTLRRFEQWFEGANHSAAEAARAFEELLGRGFAALGAELVKIMPEISHR